jgi:hypothetical protein
MEGRFDARLRPTTTDIGVVFGSIERRSPAPVVTTPTPALSIPGDLVTLNRLDSVCTVQRFPFEGLRFCILFYFIILFYFTLPPSSLLRCEAAMICKNPPFFDGTPSVSRRG